jgi:hypothetical protein
MTKANGDFYVGQWVDDLKEGFGKIVEKSSGLVYEGYWRNDL